MRKVILVAGLAQNIPLIEGCDYVGIDRGALKCAEANIPMICAIGDFDSVTIEERKKIEQVTSIVVLPQHKDETDTEMAIFYAQKQKYDEIILYGGLGGRIDHELANLYLLMHRKLPIVLMDEQNEIRRLSKGTYTVTKDKKYISILALEPSIVSEYGVEYPLDHKELSLKDIYTVSNQIIEQQAVITVHEGEILFMQCCDKKR